MPRLIDADALVEYFEGLARSLANARCFNAADAIKGAAEKVTTSPTIDAEPVRHGRWVYDKEGHTCCSECHERLPYIHCYSEEPCSEYDEKWDEEVPESLYCPNCGAKMDGDGDADQSC